MKSSRWVIQEPGVQVSEFNLRYFGGDLGGCDQSIMRREDTHLLLEGFRSLSYFK